MKDVGYYAFYSMFYKCYNVDNGAFGSMFDSCGAATKLVIGNVTVSGTTGNTAFEKTNSNFLCGIEPENKDTFYVNGSKYFNDPS